MTSTGDRQAVFLDRDGVMIEERGYLTSSEQLELIEGVGTAISQLHARGFHVVVVTNQSAIARGLLSEERLQELHFQLGTLLAEKGAQVDAWLYCPHHPDSENANYGFHCGCRKPAPGMLLQARAKLGVDLTRSYLVGDKRSDIAAARSVGCRAILIRSGQGKAEAELGPRSSLEVPDAIVNHLSEAVEWILESGGDLQ